MEGLAEDTYYDSIIRRAEVELAREGAKVHQERPALDTKGRQKFEDLLDDDPMEQYYALKIDNFVDQNRVRKGTDDDPEYYDTDLETLKAEAYQRKDELRYGKEPHVDLDGDIDENPLNTVKGRLPKDFVDQFADLHNKFEENAIDRRKMLPFMWKPTARDG